MKKPIVSSLLFALGFQALFLLSYLFLYFVIWPYGFTLLLLDFYFIILIILSILAALSILYLHYKRRRIKSGAWHRAGTVAFHGISVAVLIAEAFLFVFRQIMGLYELDGFSYELDTFNMFLLWNTWLAYLVFFIEDIVRIVRSAKKPSRSI